MSVIHNLNHLWQGLFPLELGELEGMYFPPTVDIPVIPTDLVYLHDIKIVLSISKTVSSDTKDGQRSLTQAVYLWFARPTKAG